MRNPLVPGFSGRHIAASRKPFQMQPPMQRPKPLTPRKQERARRETDAKAGPLGTPFARHLQPEPVPKPSETETEPILLEPRKGEKLLHPGACGSDDEVSNDSEGLSRREAWVVEHRSEKP